MKLLIALVLTLSGLVAKASADDLDLAFKAIHSKELQEYMQTAEARGMTLTGVEWAGEGGNSDGELVEYKLLFWKINGHVVKCHHGISAYFTTNADGSRTYVKSELSNYDLVCD